MNIRIIGYGRLAQTMVKTWKEFHQLNISSPNIISGQTHSCVFHQDNKSDLTNQDMIVLAVKPKVIHHVLSEITPFLPNDAMLVSLAAGVTLQSLKALLPSNQVILRAMPNIASEFGQSATLLLGKDKLNVKQLRIVQDSFTQLGTIDWVDDDNQLDIGTIIAGSGPAYVFYIMEAMQQAAIHLGMPNSLAEKLVEQTFLGATTIAINQHQSLKELQEKVTSPQGTTASALAVFEAKQLGLCLNEAIQAAWQKILDIRNL